MSKSTPQAPLAVIARAPFHIYYEGSAFSVSAKNRVGPFDILPGHADFLAYLSPVRSPLIRAPSSFHLRSIAAC
ncbi:hypothetical protein IPP92_01415 [Candidatus Saccharibacteria bacterium]|nr:MAG: hypothetical protein IPP92_01415 [Candidatus Saccharibacteria bacterium]